MLSLISLLAVLVKSNPPFYSCAKWQSFFKSEGKIVIFFIADSYESADLKNLKKKIELLNTPTSVIRLYRSEVDPKVKIGDPREKINFHTWSAIRVSEKRWSETKKMGSRMTEVGVCGTMLNRMFSSNLGGL